MNINDILPLLEAIVSSGRSSFLSSLSAQVIKFVSEIALNILSKVVPLRSVEERFWAKFNKDLKTLASKKASTRRKIKLLTKRKLKFLIEPATRHLKNGS